MNFSSPAADTRKKQSKRDEVSGASVIPRMSGLFVLLCLFFERTWQPSARWNFGGAFERERRERTFRVRSVIG
jgi:hypothetical protein